MIRSVSQFKNNYTIIYYFYFSMEHNWEDPAGSALLHIQRVQQLLLHPQRVPGLLQLGAQGLRPPYIIGSWTIIIVAFVGCDLSPEGWHEYIINTCWNAEINATSPLCQILRGTGTFGNILWRRRSAIFYEFLVFADCEIAINFSFSVAGSQVPDQE